MQDIIYTGFANVPTRFSSSHMSAINDTHFVGPVGRILNKEQFIPLFTAVPLYQKEFHNRPRNNIDRLTNVVKAINGIYSIEQRGIVRPIIYTLFETFSSTTSYYSVITASEDISALRDKVPINYGETVKYDILNIIKAFPSDKENIRKILKFRIKKALSGVINKSELFGLISQEANSLFTDRSGQIVASTAQGNWLDDIIHRMGWYTHALSRGNINQKLIARYHYLAKIGTVSGVVGNKFPVYFNQLISNQGCLIGKPISSAAYGIQTLGVTVVKAKHRDYLTAMTVCGMDNNITIPTSDIELWISPAIAEYSAPGTTPEQEGRSIFQIPQESKIQIRVLQDIDERLYGKLPSQTDRAKTALEGARVIADKYLNNPLNVFDMINSL